MAKIVQTTTPCRVELATEYQLPMQARLRFTQNQPYDIEMALELNGEKIDAWTLSREMVDEAAHTPRSKAGEGDLTIKTFCSQFILHLHPPGQAPATLFLNRVPIREFMDKVNGIMPWGDAIKAAMHELDDWLEGAD